MIASVAVAAGYAAVLLGGAGVAGGMFWLNASVPNLDGTFLLPGLAAPAEVVRDANGIPLIIAQSDTDAYAALGFIHAQDRLWQMDLQRRAAKGQLAAIAGEDAFRSDRLMRTLDVAGRAERQFAGLAPDVQAAFQAYANGVNAWLGVPGQRLPPEFALAGFEPEPWVASDGLLWGGLMAVRLSGSWRAQYLRMRLAKRLAPERIDQLLDEPGQGGGQLAAVPAANAPPSTLARLADNALPPPPASSESGSNAWVLDGSLTRSGKPLLANDPHLEFGAPILWYLARIETPGLSLAGVTVPGLPFHILGHNGNVAWGLTTAEADLQDLYLEPLRPGGYQTPSGVRPFVTRTETIAVRDRPPVTIEVRSTRHGPVLSDVLGGPPATDYALALAATFMADDDLTPEAIYRLNRAATVPAAIQALRTFHAPAQNVFLADRQGAIAQLLAGRVPDRGPSPRPAGPFDGADDAFDWRGWIPFDDMPRRVDPAGGRLGNANERPALPGIERINGRWVANYRAPRLNDLLAAVAPGQADAAAMAAMQMDTVSLAARELVPLLLDAAGPWPERQAILDLLRQWDGAMDRARMEPLVYMAWLRALNRALYQDDVGPLFGEMWSYRPRFVGWVLTGGHAWCDDITTAPAEDCGAVVRHALDDAMADLERRFGPRVAEWRWGKAHLAVFDHPMLRGIPVLGGLAGPRIENDGGPETLNRGAMQISDEDTPFANVHGPGFRAVYDLADLDASRFIIATGQAGNPLSPHYQNLMERWRNGAAVSLGGTLDDRRASARNRVVLQPPAAQP
ncbi:MAG: penicillin acylase family protein [Proteobacteria bacterium]|nr:penicillin acylase family protein [Pseudomonadota bacterium]